MSGTAGRVDDVEVEYRLGGIGGFRSAVEERIKRGFDLFVNEG